MTVPPADALRDALFIKQVKGCTKLKTEWDNYYKAPIGSEIRSFEYLHNSAMQVVERERFEHARKMVTGKGRGQDAMPAPGGKKGEKKGKGKGKGTSPTDAEDPSRSPDPRADRPCAYQAAGTCRLGDKCPYKHTPEKTRRPGKGTDVAAAPSGDTGSKSICRWYRDTGSCKFGKDCTNSHDTPSRKRDKKSERPSDRDGKKDRKVRPSDGTGKKDDPKKKKKARPGAVAEIATSSSDDQLSSDQSDRYSSSDDQD
jgi:hypothetical protein